MFDQILVIFTRASYNPDSNTWNTALGEITPSMI